MFFTKRKEEKKSERMIREALKRDPMFKDKINNEHRIFQESVELLQTTSNLSTFTERYYIATTSAGILNRLFLEIGDNSCCDIQTDIDSLFIERLGSIVRGEVERAEGLKTESGRRKRLSVIVNCLEGCDRKCGGSVDAAILELEEYVFSALYRDVDWSEEPEDCNISLSEDIVTEGLSKAVKEYAEKRGLPKDRVDDILKKTFQK